MKYNYIVRYKYNYIVRYTHNGNEVICYCRTKLSAKQHARKMGGTWEALP